VIAESAVCAGEAVHHVRELIAIDRGALPLPRDRVVERGDRLAKLPRAQADAADRGGKCGA
jgi:hypothetical protein